jgi:hypothetical protein
MHRAFSTHPAPAYSSRRSFRTRTNTSQPLPRWPLAISLASTQIRSRTERGHQPRGTATSPSIGVCLLRRDFVRVHASHPRAHERPLWKPGSLSASAAPARTLLGLVLATRRHPHRSSTSSNPHFSPSSPTQAPVQSSSRSCHGPPPAATPGAGPRLLHRRRFVFNRHKHTLVPCTIDHIQHLALGCVIPNPIMHDLEAIAA